MNINAIRLVVVGALTSFVVMCKIFMVIVTFLNTCINSTFLGCVTHYCSPT